MHIAHIIDTISSKNDAMLHYFVIKNGTHQTATLYIRQVYISSTLVCHLFDDNGFSIGHCVYNPKFIRKMEH